MSTHSKSSKWSFLKVGGWSNNLNNIFFLSALKSIGNMKYILWYTKFVTITVSWIVIIENWMSSAKSCLLRPLIFFFSFYVWYWYNDVLSRAWKSKKKTAVIHSIHNILRTAFKAIWNISTNSFIFGWPSDTTSHFYELLHLHFTCKSISCSGVPTQKIACISNVYQYFRLSSSLLFLLYKPTFYGFSKCQTNRKEWLGRAGCKFCKRFTKGAG